MEQQRDRNRQRMEKDAAGDQAGAEERSAGMQGPAQSSGPEEPQPQPQYDSFMRIIRR